LVGGWGRRWPRCLATVCGWCLRLASGSEDSGSRLKTVVFRSSQPQEFRQTYGFIYELWRQIIVTHLLQSAFARSQRRRRFCCVDQHPLTRRHTEQRGCDSASPKATLGRKHETSWIIFQITNLIAWASGQAHCREAAMDNARVATEHLGLPRPTRTVGQATAS
jgi:hypothetical protein